LGYVGIERELTLGAGTFAGGDGSRQPSALELSIAKGQGELFGKYVQRFK
jgi:NAD(P)H dehydrogenase (quinone)